MSIEEKFWDTDSVIKDLLFNSSLSNAEIAQEVDMTLAELNKRIRQLGLDWINKRKRKYSRGQESLYNIMSGLLPGETIEMEYSIPGGMRLDIYCPSYALAAEYHGRQHFFYSDFFYGTRDEFKRAKERDRKKAQWCRDNGIALVVFSFTDDLTRNVVFERLLHALKDNPAKKLDRSKRLNYNSEFYERTKEYRRKENKRLYRLKKEYDGKKHK